MNKITMHGTVTQLKVYEKAIFFQIVENFRNPTTEDWTKTYWDARMFMPNAKSPEGYAEQYALAKEMKFPDKYVFEGNIKQEDNEYQGEVKRRYFIVVQGVRVDERKANPNKLVAPEPPKEAPPQDDIVVDDNDMPF